MISRVFRWTKGLLSCALLLICALVAPFFGEERASPISAVARAQSVAAPPESRTASPRPGATAASPAPRKGGEENGLKPFKLAMGLIAGLALFLYGVEQMARGFQAAAGDRIKDWLTRFTKNRFAAAGTGMVATTLLDSSSVTIILLITLIHAGLISFTNSLGVVLGANIGTAVGSQLIAFEIHEYAPLALAAGVLLHLAGRSDRAKNAGLILFGLGLLFFGLGYLGDAMEPLKEYKPFTDLMARLGKTPLLGALAGCLFTLVIQSSSATVGIAITMAQSGLIDLPAGVAIMLGAEIGTVSDTLLASIGRSREAVRTAVFHLLFNLVTVSLGLLLVGPLTRAAQMLPGSGVARDIANAHLTFNVLGVALVIGFLPWIARALERVIPPKPDQTGGPEPGADP
ncbi:MAG: Na/Pi cotransporter family protein [Cytophagales bacterium]|nr:Na/Pi cotransporter family protein [Armatimonadota bacterium]